MTELTETALLTFKDTDFRITLKALLNGNESLFIRIENMETADAWSAKFSSKYIDIMTRKTGNFKRFSVFIEMILSALRNSSSTVFLDILTPQDLLSMKNNGELTETPSTSNKLYLILTYAIAFDRIHYPLPLLAEDLNIDTLPKQNTQLESELDDLKHQIRELHKERDAFTLNQKKLIKENDKLKYEMKHLKDESTHHDSKNSDTIPQYSISEFTSICDKIRNIMMDSDIDVQSQKLIGNCLWKLEDIISDLITVKKTKPKTEHTSQTRVGRPSSNVYTASLHQKSSASKSSSRKPEKNQEYKILKSQPLGSNLYTKPKTKSKINSRGTMSRRPEPSRSTSRSSFKRFEPTAYIKERERKLEEKRRSSSPGFRNSVNSNTSRNSSVNTTYSNISKNISLVKKYKVGNNLKSRKDQIDYVPVKKKNTLTKEYTNDSSDIEARLEKLHRYLMETR